jgi:hypothetical protein
MPGIDETLELYPCQDVYEKCLTQDDDAKYSEGGGFIAVLRGLFTYPIFSSVRIF